MWCTVRDFMNVNQFGVCSFIFGFEGEIGYLVVLVMIISYLFTSFFYFVVLRYPSTNCIYRGVKLTTFGKKSCNRVFYIFL